MEPARSLLEVAKGIDVNDIQNPVLRDLISDFQAKSSLQVAEDYRYWTDSDWQQWREHSSHNPW